MADMIRDAAAWFEGKRLAHMSVPIVYRAADSLIDVACDATVSTSTRSVMDSAGQFITVQVRTFVIAVSQYSAVPRRDDRITITEGGVAKTYFVASATPGDPVWLWGDRANLTRKISAIPA